MSKLDAATATILSEQIKRIHSAVNDGTLDRDTVNDALAKLTELAQEKADAKSDSFKAFTGQSDKSAVSGASGVNETSAPRARDEPPQSQG